MGPRNSIGWRAEIVAALYVRKETVYHGLEGVDCWDVMRNARYWPGGAPVVAHPPCAQWGNLKGMARRDPAEKSLGLLAVEQVRRWGGVLEHPQRSSLWDEGGASETGAGVLQLGLWRGNKTRHVRRVFDLCRSVALGPSGGKAHLVVYLRVADVSESAAPTLSGGGAGESCRDLTQQS
jgi:hypothetical protein